MTPFRQILGLALTSLALACGAPMRPYGHPEYELRRVPPLQSMGTVPFQQARLLIVGALEDLTVGPIGGAYDEQDYSMAPLEQIYWYHALGTKLVDSLHAALVSRGVRAAKDYLDLGAPLPYRDPAPPVEVLRGSINSFSFSRHAQGFDVLLGDVSLRLLEGRTGRELWHHRQALSFWLPWSRQDPFFVFADALAARLLADPAFRSALSGGA